jgi:hypothetical protein
VKAAESIANTFTYLPCHSSPDEKKTTCWIGATPQVACMTLIYLVFFSVKTLSPCVHLRAQNKGAANRLMRGEG